MLKTRRHLVASFYLGQIVRQSDFQTLIDYHLLGGGNQLMFGNLIALQFGQGKNWPLGAALSLTLMVIVMIALVYFVKISSSENNKK